MSMVSFSYLHILESTVTGLLSCVYLFVTYVLGPYQLHIFFMSTIQSFGMLLELFMIQLCYNN